MAVLVPACPDDRRHALRIDAQKVVRMAGGLHGVDGDADRAVGTVLEADREARAGCELTVQLGLGGAGTDGAPSDEVGNELGADCQLYRAGRRYPRQYGIVSRCVLPTYLIVSNNSHPTGTPISLISLRSSRPVLSPLLIWNDPSISGSLINPFHPTVVRGFSKYTRITTSNPGQRPSCTPARSLRAYSFAWSMSWIEHGPTTTSSLLKGSVWRTMEAHVRREAEMVWAATGETGKSWRSNAGGMRGSY